jgi:TPR repeat protein
MQNFKTFDSWLKNSGDILAGGLANPHLQRVESKFCISGWHDAELRLRVQNFNEGKSAAGCGGPARRWRSMLGQSDYFNRAMAAGRSAAMSDLAAMYETGRGVPADLARARQLYQQAADAGDEAGRKWLESHRK